MAMPEGKTDVAILTVIPAELHAAVSALGLPAASRRKDGFGTVYFHGQIASELCSRSFSVVVGCIGMAGNPSAAAAAAEFIQSHQPKAFFLLGIAAGLRGKIKIGEVIFSDRVVAYEQEALVREAGRSWAEPRPDIDRITHAMNQDLMAYRCDVARIARRVHRMGLQVPRPSPGQETEFEQHVTSTAALRVATIASGDKLLRDPAKLRAVRAQIHGKIEAGEMEAAGVVAACSRRGIPWLVVRGISDFGDEFKNDAFHGYAAGMAAAALADFIEHGLDFGPSESAGFQQPLAVSVTELTWPYADFSIINTTDHPIQVTGIRLRRLAMLYHDPVECIGAQRKMLIDRCALRMHLSVDWDAPRVADRSNVLGARVLNLKPGEAEAFRLDLAAENVTALVALEVDWISAKAPKKAVLHGPDLLAVHPSYFIHVDFDGLKFDSLKGEGAISVVRREEAFDCLADGRKPGLWEGQSFADCGWEELLASAAGELSRPDPEGSFERLRQAQKSGRVWGSILTSFADAYDSSASRLWERVETCIRGPGRQQLTAAHGTEARAISMDPERARLIIDRMLARRKGAEAEWLLGFIDSDLEVLGEFSILHEVALERLETLQGERGTEYLMAVGLVAGLPGSGYAWWKQTRRLQPGLHSFNWRPFSPRLARFWDMLLCKAGESELAEGLRSPEMLERYALAVRADLPDSVAIALARDTSRKVRLALAKNPMVSRGPLQVLAHGGCEVAEERLYSWVHLTSRELEDGLGYIHVPHFGDDRIVAEFGQALEQLGGTRGLVLDVRDTCRGLTEVVQKMLDQLSQERQPRAYEGPMVVLFNARSVGMAERFAVALERLGRAKVLRTQKKGLDSGLDAVSDPLLADARVELRRCASHSPVREHP
jgi:nucleoside phosphorylase